MSLAANTVDERWSGSAASEFYSGCAKLVATMSSKFLVDRASLSGLVIIRTSPSRTKSRAAASFAPWRLN